MKLTGKSLKNLIKEVLDEGILDQMKAEKELRSQYFKVRDLYRQGKATQEEVSAAYQAMTNLDTDQFYTADELERYSREAAERDAKYPPEDHDAVKRSGPTPKFNTEVPGPSGEVTIQGIPMMADEDDDTGLYRREGLMYEGDESILEMFEDAMLEEGGHACGACLFETLQEASCGCPDLMGEAVYQGKTVQLNKPTAGDVKKFKVYVNSGKKDAKGRVKAKKVNFGDKKMKIKKSNPKRRKSFRARHKCHTAKDKKTARYWSCKKW
jgi:hypothetical protein